MSTGGNEMVKVLLTQLKKARMQAGLTQCGLAQALTPPVSVSLITKLETRRATPSLRVLKQIGQVLNVPLDELSKDF
jgi:transcriptional regulator with XRE-family HTH domain